MVLPLLLMAPSIGFKLITLPLTLLLLIPSIAHLLAAHDVTVAVDHYRHRLRKVTTIFRFLSKQSLIKGSFYQNLTTAYLPHDKA